jgi:hypothetical protein
MPGAGTLPTDSVLFGGFLVGVLLIVGASISSSRWPLLPSWSSCISQPAALMPDQNPGQPLRRGRR